MKNISKALLLCASVLILNSNGWAADSQWELSTGNLGSVNFMSGRGGSVTDISLAGSSFVSQGTGVAAMPSSTLPSVGYFLQKELEIVFTPSYGLETVTPTGGSATSTSYLQLLLGANYSFGSEIDNAIFLQVQAGVGIATATTSTTNLALLGEVGKRFKIVDHVSWVPAVAYLWTNAATTATTSLSIIPVQFSMFW